MANVPPPEKVIFYLPWWQDDSCCPLCFSSIKRRWSATFTHSAIAIRRRPTRSDPCTYVEIVGPSFDLNRVLLRRIFLNDDKSRYVSVSFYPAHNYQLLFEFGVTRHLPLILTAEYDNIVAERLLGLVEAMCRNEHFQWRSEDKVFRMNSTLSYRIARFTPDKHRILLKLPQLRNLQYIFYMISN